MPAESRFDPRFAFDGATLQGTRDLLEARGDVEHGEAGRGAWLGDDQRQLTESMLTDARIVEHFAQIVERDANVLTRDLRQLLVGLLAATFCLHAVPEHMERESLRSWATHLTTA